LPGLILYVNCTIANKLNGADTLTFNNLIMPNHLTTLGIIHTAISILAIIVAVIALLSSGEINPLNKSGRLYILLTIIACLTALPIMKTGHPTAGHALAILILILLPIGIYAHRIRIFGKLAGYAQVIILSTTLFISMVPTIIETLTRLPLDHPLADGPNSPAVKMGFLILIIIFIIGITYQVIKLRAKRKTI
jgi:hypothetical protein